jgi:hypothetical protein
MRGNPFGPGGRLRDSLRVNRMISQRIKQAKGVAARRAPLVTLVVLQIKPILSREGRKGGKEIITQAIETKRECQTGIHHLQCERVAIYIVQIEERLRKLGSLRWRLERAWATDFRGG